MNPAAFYAVLEHSTDTVGDHGGSRTEERTRVLCVFPREAAHTLCQRLNTHFADKGRRVKMVPQGEPVLVDRFSCIPCGPMVGASYMTTPHDYFHTYASALAALEAPPVQHVRAGPAWVTG